MLSDTIPIPKYVLSITCLWNTFYNTWMEVINNKMMSRKELTVKQNNGNKK